MISGRGGTRSNIPDIETPTDVSDTSDKRALTDASGTSDRKTTTNVSDTSDNNKKKKTPDNHVTHIPSSNNASSTNSQQTQEIEITIITDNLHDGAPNLLLNCHDRAGRREIYIAAALAIILQLGAVLYFGIITYHKPIQSRFLKDGNSIVKYAFPCAAIGTILLVFGLFICSWVVGESTIETYYETGKHQIFVVWLQKGHTVSDQEFKPYAIYPASKRDYFTISRRQNIENDRKEIRDLYRKVLYRLSESPIVWRLRTDLGKLSKLYQKFKAFITKPVNQNDPEAENMSSESSISAEREDESNKQPLYWPLNFITVVGSFISLVGFISQFIGMRGLNWTASIVQLGITIVVTVLRVIVRRGLGKTPNRTALKPKFELDWFVLSFGNIAAVHWINSDKKSVNTPKEIDESGDTWSSKWKICTGGEQRYHSLNAVDTGNDPNSDRSIKDSLPHQIMLARKNLGIISKWRSPVLEEAISLSRAIEAAASTFLIRLPPNKYEWSIQATYVTQKQMADSTKSVEVDPTKINEADSMRNVKDSIYITITKGEDNGWRVDDAEIEAILSLWLYSTSSTDLSETSRLRSLRVYGPSESKERLNRDFEWWMRENIPKIFKYTEKDFAELISDCTVVGFRTEHARKTPVQNNPIEGCLVLECQDKQQRLFSRDLFFSFMRSVAKMPEVDIESASIAHPVSSSTMTGGWKQMKLKSDDISDLARRLEKIGFGSLSDIYIDLIIPLSLEHKLTNVNNIIDEITREAYKYEHSQQWEKLVDTCIRLLDLALLFDLKKESSSPLAIAICLGFLYRLHHEIKLQKSERRAEQELTTQFKKLKKRFIRDNLQSSAYFSTIFPDELRFLAVSVSILAGPSYSSTTSFPDSFQIAAENLKFIKKRKLEHIQNSKAFEKTDAFGWSLLHYAANLTPDSINIDSNYQMSDESRNSRDLMGWTPLHHACFYGNEKMVKMLLEYETPIEVAGKDGITPMHCAVQSGKTEILQKLIEGVNQRPKKHTRKSGRHVDHNERHPIHWAAVEGNVKMVRLMKGDIRLKDRFGWTPLHLAAIYDHRKLLRYITEDHAETINTSDNELRTPLHLAVKGKLKDAVQILIQAGARINTVAKNGLTPLHVAVKHKQKEILKLLLKQGTNKNVMDMEGRTPLYLSVEDGDIETINLLIEGGANAKVATEDGRTPLHIALSRGQDGLEVAKILLRAGADANAKAQDGATGMHIAAQFGSLFEILNFLVEIDQKSLDINAIDEYGQTPLLIAIYEADWNASERLLNMGARIDADRRDGYTPVLGAVIRGNKDILQQLLGKGASVDDEDEDGYSALHLAVLHGNKNITSLLLKAGASIDAVERSRNETPLHIAVRMGYSDIVQILLDSGANMRLPNDFDFSPLEYALYRGDLPMVKILIEHDKKSAIKAALQKNELGETPLHTLTKCHNDEGTKCKMLDELLAIGPEIEINAKNGKGSTPLDLALCEASENRLFITKLLGKGAEAGSETTQRILEDWKSQNVGLQEPLSD